MALCQMVRQAMFRVIAGIMVVAHGADEIGHLVVGGGMCVMIRRVN